MTTLLQSVITALRSAGCVFAEAEARLLVEAAAGAEELAELVARRSRGEPLEYVVGWAEFCGLRIAVEPGVFVPRRRSEFLVDLAVQRATAVRERLTVVDLCCGSGALGAALAARLPGAEVHAADLDPVAVRCARRNLPRVYRGDLFDALPGQLRGRIDLLVAITPYVPTADIRLMPIEAREHEPRTALEGGTDGLALLRRLIPRAHEWLAPEATFLTEVSEAQAPLVAALLTGHRLPSTIEQLIVDGEAEATVVIAHSP